MLADRGAILDAIQNEYPGAVEQNRLIRSGRQIAEELGFLAPDQTRAILMTLLSRVDIRPDRVEINIRRCYLIELLEQIIIIYQSLMWWLCWETAANLSLEANSLIFGKMQGIFPT
jgi:hypothetical protein